MWGGRRESNPQRPEPQSGALPVELLPPDFLIIAMEGAVGLRRQASGLIAGSHSLVILLIDIGLFSEAR